MKLMNSIEIDGIFWLEETEFDENKGVSGHLTIDTEGRSQLRLHDVNRMYQDDLVVKTFQSMEDGVIHTYDWITGLGSKGECIWMHNGYHSGKTSLQALPTENLFSAQTVFIHQDQPLKKISIERPNQIAFNGLTCEIEGVWEWLGVSGFQYPINVAQWYWGNHEEILEVRYKCPPVDFLESREPLQWDENKPEVSVAFRIVPTSYTAPWFPEDTYPKFALEETTTIEVKPKTGLLKISDVVKHLLILRNFFAVSMDTPVNVVQCNVSAANACWGEVNGKPVTGLSMYRNIGRLRGEPFKPGRTYVIINRSNRIGPHGHLWTRLTAWYVKYRKLGYAIEEYLDGRFIGGHLSGKVMALWRAIDALAGEDRKPIADKLRHTLKPVIKDKQERRYWISKMNRIRGSLAHGDKKQPPSLIDLDVAYALFIIIFNFHILTELGLESDDLLGKDDRVGLLEYLQTNHIHIGSLHRHYVAIVDECKQLGHVVDSPEALKFNQIKKELRSGDTEGEELKIVLEVAGWSRQGADAWISPSAKLS